MNSRMRVPIVLLAFLLVFLLPSSALPQACENRPGLGYQPDPRMEPTLDPSSPDSYVRTDCLLTSATCLGIDPVSPSNYRFGKLPGQVVPWTVADGTYPLCPSRDYHGQPSAIDACGASGVLVAPDVIATAGHNIPANPADWASWCSNARIVFDYANYNGQQLPFNCNANGSHCYVPIPGEDVYRCSSVIVRYVAGMEDWGLVRLTAVPAGRTPVELDTVHQAVTGAPTLVMGHPNRIPAKVEAGAVTANELCGMGLQADGHCFKGSSGSMVLHAETHKLLGVVYNANRCLPPDIDHDYSNCCREIFQNHPPNCGRVLASSLCGAEPYLP